jgi:hypothetical protein
LGDRFEEDGTEWKPLCKMHIDAHIRPLVNRQDREWYFDGRYIFSFNNMDLNAVVRSGTYLTQDGQFRKILATTIDTQELQFRDKIEPEERSCLAFVASSGSYSISPPIWKNLSEVGGRQLDRLKSAGILMEDEDDPEEPDTAGDAGADNFTFDKINEHLSVNLNFALAAGKEIGRTFGYEYVDPLQLPRLMIELHTVNLPNVPQEVKATYDIGIDFTHALAWLLGMSRKANTLETYVLMRSLLKYLTQKGIFRNSAFHAENVFIGGATVNDVPLKDLDTLIKDKDFTKLSLSAIIDAARANRKIRKADVSSIGSLQNED